MAIENVTARVRELAGELSSALIHDKRRDGSELVRLKDGAVSWMQPLIHAVHGDKLPDDTTYQFIERSADAIADSREDSEPLDSIYELEADCYTHELTGWLHARADHVFYLDEVLADCRYTSGTDLLMAAQQRHIHEVGASLVAELEKLAERVS